MNRKHQNQEYQQIVSFIIPFINSLFSSFRSIIIFEFHSSPLSASNTKYTHNNTNKHEPSQKKNSNKANNNYNNNNTQSNNTSRNNNDNTAVLSLSSRHIIMFEDFSSFYSSYTHSANILSF